MQFQQGQIVNSDYKAAIYAAQTQAGAPTPIAPKTIASAVSRMDGVNERLNALRDQLCGVADAIGALRSAQANEAKIQPASVGAVGRLNDSADGAHVTLNEIDEVVAAIMRALG